MDKPAKKPDEKLSVIYDGECPFCSSYVRMVRLKDTVGDIQLINARDTHPLVRKIAAQGYDLDEGMVVLYRGQVFHGAYALHMLSALSTESGLFNRAMKALFRHEKAARLLYPFLRLGRNCALFLKGKKKIHAPGK